VPIAIGTQLVCDFTSPQSIQYPVNDSHRHSWTSSGTFRTISVMNVESHSMLLHFWTLSTVSYSERTQCFGDWIRFCPRVRTWGGSHSSGSTNTANLNHSRGAGLGWVHQKELISINGISWACRKCRSLSLEWSGDRLRPSRDLSRVLLRHFTKGVDLIQFPKHGVLSECRTTGKVPRLGTLIRIYLIYY
jgi:hypothetical protein